MANPLEQLLVDGSEVDSAMLATVLEPFIRIDKISKDIRGTKEWSRLSTSQKVVVTLLARRALAGLGLIGEEEVPIGPQALEKTTGVKGDTLRKELSRLYADKLVQKDHRRYFVPGYSIEATQRLLERRRGR